jgi:hypothetical protein
MIISCDKKTKFLNQEIKNYYTFNVTQIGTSKENKWLIEDFIRENDTDSFITLKQEWYNIINNADNEIKEGGRVHEEKTNAKWYEMCKNVYSKYTTIPDKYSFNGLYFLFFKDNLVYEKKVSTEYVDYQLLFVKQLTNIKSEEQLEISNNKDNINKDQLLSIKTNETLERKLDMMNKISNNPDSFPHCFVITQLDELILFTPKEPFQDLWYYFNQVQLNDNITFCTYQNMYKFRDDKDIQKDWVEKENTNTIVSYIRQDSTRPFQKIFITPNSVIIKLSFSAESTPKIILEQISTTFNLPQQLESNDSNQKSIKGICYIKVPKLISNLKLFLFFIHSHPLFSSFIFAEESRVVMTDKRYLYFTIFTNPCKPKEFVSFTIYNVEKSDITKMECTPIGPVTSVGGGAATSGAYIMLKIRHCPIHNKDRSLIPNIVSIMTNLITEYYQNEAEIRAELSSFSISEPKMVAHVQQVRRNTKKEVIKGTKTRNQPNYPTIYTNEQIQLNPSILRSFYHVNLDEEPEHLRINHEENESLKDSHPQGLYFPTAKFPKLEKQSDITPAFYICNRETDYKYINTKTLSQLGTKSMIPYCYRSDHTVKVVNEKVTASNYIKSKGMILSKNQAGSALPWITNWYSLHQPSGIIYRKGVTDPTDQEKSILYVIQTVLNKKMYDSLVVKPKKIPDFIATIDQVKQLHGLLVNDMKQTFPNDILSESKLIYPEYTNEQLLNQFETDYINPYAYYSYLCRYFNIDLIFFKKDDVNSEFYLYHPPYYHQYQSLEFTPSDPKNHKPPKTVIGVVINQGTENRFEDVPICELLFTFQVTNSTVVNDKLINPPKEDELSFEFDQGLVGYTNYSISKMYLKKTIEIKINVAGYYLPGTSLVIVNQQINSKGIVQWLTVSPEDKKIQYTIYLPEPIHSLPIPTVENIPIHLYEITASLTSYGLEIIDKSSVYHNYKGVVMKAETNITYFFITDIVKEENKLSDFIRYQRFARYLNEYTSFLFSTFINEQKRLQTNIRFLQTKITEPNTNTPEEQTDFTTEFIKVNSQLKIKEPLSDETIYKYINLFIQEDVNEDEILFNRLHLTKPLVRVLNKIFIGNDDVKLVVPNEIVKKKLYYMLLQEYKTNKDKLVDYHNEVNMRNFFMIPDDFTFYPFHQIMNKETFQSFISTIESSTMIEDSTGSLLYKPRIISQPVSDTFGFVTAATAERKPYILYKQFEIKEIQMITSWIMQPVSSLQEALFLSKQWTRYKYNALQEWKLKQSDTDRFEQKDIDEKVFNKFIWTSDSTYHFFPSEPPSSPYYLSIAAPMLGSTFLQVMLPKNI